MLKKCHECFADKFSILTKGHWLCEHIIGSKFSAKNTSLIFFSTLSLSMTLALSLALSTLCNISKEWSITYYFILCWVSPVELLTEDTRHIVLIASLHTWVYIMGSKNTGVHIYTFLMLRISSPDPLSVITVCWSETCLASSHGITRFLWEVDLGTSRCATTLNSWRSTGPTQRRLLHVVQFDYWEIEYVPSSKVILKLHPHEW